MYYNYLPCYVFLIGCVFLDTNNKGQSFLKGTMILTSSIIVVKILGLLFRIFITGMIGPTGAGYFTVAYEIYNTLFALATAGLPIALSRTVSENLAQKRYRDVRMIHKISVPVFTFAGSIGFILMIILAFFIPGMFNAPGSFYSIIALAPTILFACIMSIYRGYNQGFRNVVPTAVSEIIEAVCKFFIGYAISYSIMRYGMNEFKNNGTFLGVKYETKGLAEAAIVPFASAGAIIGISMGAMFGFIYLLVRFKRKGDGLTIQEIRSAPKPRSSPAILRRILKTAIPIGIGSIILNVAGIIDTTFILTRIQHIMKVNPEALIAQYSGKITPEIINSADGIHTFLLGCYSFTLPITMLIPAITQTFGVVSLPRVTAAWTIKNKEKLNKSINSVLRMTTLITIPAGIGLSLIGNDLLRLIYPRRPVTVSIASGILPIVAISYIFVATATPVCSMLQAVGRADLPVKIISIGLVIKIITNYILVGIPEINIQGAGIGTMIGYAFVLVVGLYLLCRETRIRPNFKDIIVKPLIASIICGLAAYSVLGILKNFLPLIIAMIISLILAVIVYIISVLALHGISKEDTKMIPGGKKFLKILEKLKFVV